MATTYLSYFSVCLYNILILIIFTAFSYMAATTLSIKAFNFTTFSITISLTRQSAQRVIVVVLCHLCVCVCHKLALAECRFAECRGATLLHIFADKEKL